MLKPSNVPSSPVILPAWSPTASVVPYGTPAWTTSSPDEELPVFLAQLRGERQRIEQQLQEAESRVVYYLRRGPLASRQSLIKLLIERYYSLSIPFINRSHTLLDEAIINENLSGIVNEVNFECWPGFVLDWQYVSGSQPVPATLLNRYAEKWNWAGLAGNELIDWSEKLINSNFKRLEEHFTALSANKGINWTPDLLEAFSDCWDYSQKGLLGNDALPWEDESLPALLLRIAPEDAGPDEDEVTQAANAMRFRFWSRRSLNRHSPVSADDLRQHAGELDWDRLSENPSLPFSFSLLSEFEEYWNWELLSYNKGLYQKVVMPLLSDAVVHELLVLNSL